MNKIKDLKLFIQNKIVISNDSLGVYIPKIQPYLSQTNIKLIEKFIKEQEQKGVNFSIENGYKIDIVGIFEASKLIHDYYKQNEKVPKSDTKKLKEAIKMCAKHIQKFDINYELVFDKLLQIEDKKYFTEENLKEYKLFFNESFVQSLKKQSSKYPVLLFNEIIISLDELNDKHYKTKDTKTSEQLKKLILNVFELDTKTLRVEDKKEYLGDISDYRSTMKFYFEIVRRYSKNHLLSENDLSFTIDQFNSISFVAYLQMPYERLCNKEEFYLKLRSLIKRLEQYKIVTTNNKEEAKKIITEIETECVEMIEGQPFLHGFTLEDEELFYSITKQIQTIKQCENLNTLNK
jgi:hypothetical protein